MNNQIKRVEALSPSDLAEFPVWQFANDDRYRDELTVRPVKKVPARNLNGRLVGVQVRLAVGAQIWALLGNVAPDNARLTHHFLTLSTFWKGCWFTMARYHDFDSCERGPQALADFLGMKVDEVFPIKYDIRRFCLGESSALAGTIEADPHDKLTRAEIIRLAVPKC